MSEIAAIYAHLDAVHSENPTSPSVEAFFADLTAAGFDLNSALAEIANLDSRLSELASIDRVIAYSHANKLESIEHLATALIINYPGSLQEIAKYCLQKNSELSAVSGGRSGVLDTSLPTVSKSRLKNKLSQICKELEANGVRLDAELQSAMECEMARGMVFKFTPYDNPSSL